MPYRPVRNRRYEKLRKSGFTKLEASILSKVPEYVPYMAALRHDRRRDLRQAQAKNLSQPEYEKLVSNLYKLKGWSEYGLNASIPLHKMDNKAVYKMLREYEDKYKDDQGGQAFNSPWVKRQKDFRDFSKKFNNSVKQFHD
jgi:hypothetical protein